MNHLPWVGHICIPNGLLRIDVEAGAYCASQYWADTHGSLHEQRHHYGRYDDCSALIAAWYAQSFPATGGAEVGDITKPGVADHLPQLGEAA